MNKEKKLNLIQSLNTVENHLYDFLGYDYLVDNEMDDEFQDNEAYIEYLIKDIRVHINAPTPLDSEVEEDIRLMKVSMTHMGFNFNSTLDKILQVLSDKNERIERQGKRISDLNDTLEITVIAEMLDLINNGNPIPLTRKELQSELTAIDEAVDKAIKFKELNNIDEAYETIYYIKSLFNKKRCERGGKING